MKKHRGIFPLIIFFLYASAFTAAAEEKLNTIPLAVLPAYIEAQSNASKQATISTSNHPGSYPQTVSMGTNQTKCYNNTTEITCPDIGSAFFGQDAAYEKPFTCNSYMLGSDIYLGCGSNYWATPTTARVWSDAQSYCASLPYVSYTYPWRLPTLVELLQIVDASRTSPAVSTVYFPQMQSTTYWTSDAYGTTDAWVVDFNNGSSTFTAKSSTAATICVTSTSLYPGIFFDYGDGTLMDTRSSLMWEKTGSQISANWQNALSVCEQSATGNYTDWRLPTKKELESIIDPSASSLWNEKFTAQSGSYWSSTTQTDASSNAWIVTAAKKTTSAGKTESNYVRCVRSVPTTPYPGNQGIMSGTWTGTGNTTTKIANCPFTLTPTVGPIINGFISSEAIVGASPPYSYHALGNQNTGISMNVYLSHLSDTDGMRAVWGYSSGTAFSGTAYQVNSNGTMSPLLGVTASRVAKSKTQQDYDITGQWTGNVLGTTVTVDIRSASASSGGQSVSYFNARLSVPYGNKYSPFNGILGFIDSDGSVFAIRNSFDAVYVFEGTRNGNTITGSLRNFDTSIASGITLTRIAGITPESSSGVGSSIVPLLLLNE